MDRKRYMREVYPSFWLTARQNIYGFLQYDRYLCEFITCRVTKGSKLLEVAVGTGYPFADYLQKAGYYIHGIDIAPVLIEECRKLNPDIDSRIGDAENLGYENGFFDCTYCFHSTWYFPDLEKAISEMLRVTRSRGLVMFDIQNRHHPVIKKAYRNNVLLNRRIIRYPLNIARVIFHRGIPIWNWNAEVSQVPAYPGNVLGYLKDLGVAESQIQILARQEDQSIVALDETERDRTFTDYDRLVFVIIKQS